MVNYKQLKYINKELLTRSKYINKELLTRSKYIS